MDDIFLLDRFLAIVGMSLACVVLGTFMLKEQTPRQFLYFMTAGVFIWSGIGGSAESVAKEYVWIYCGFVFLLTGSFTLSSILLSKGLKLPEFDQNTVFLNQKFWQVFVVLYLLFILFPLVYPEFKLFRLIKPPPPDLHAAVENRFKLEGDTMLEVLFYYANVLIFPFFLFSLHALGLRWWWLFIALAFQFYAKYCVNAYLSRHEMALLLLMVYLYFWYRKIIPRQVMVLGSLAALPMLMFFFHSYAMIRLGGGFDLEFGILGVIESSLGLFYEETYYPKLVSEMMEGDRPQEIFRYLTWIVSLPIPSKFTANWDIMKIGYEYTEYMTGGILGETIFTIILPGLLGESIFIYGKAMWWIHAVTVGFIVALICHVTRADKRLFFVMTYFQLHILLIGRGGVAMFLILIINYMLLFWPFLLLLFYKGKQVQHQGPYGRMGQPYALGGYGGYHKEGQEPEWTEV
jgi:hypothetical protein